MEPFAWLEQWYAGQCNGEWEENAGVSIESLDNPGWLVTIHLVGTALGSRAYEDWLLESGDPPTEKNGYVGGAEWMECRVRNGKFVGAGDPAKLRKIVESFRDWALRI